MDCSEVQDLVERYLDKELALSELRSIEQHMGHCDDCCRLRDNLMTINNAIAEQGKFVAPASLKNKVRKNLKEAIDEDERGPAILPLIGFGSGIAAISMVLAWFVLSFYFLAPDMNALSDNIVGAHVQSMMVDHVIDIKSSDTHVVKPWFNGKLDFAPVVRDYSNEGYKLVGGRLDYVQNQQVSAIVYRRREHTINLFMWPEDVPAKNGFGILAHRGYNMVSWQGNGLNYWLISDLNKDELQALAELLEKTSQPPA